jgi:hypothetical protein
LCGCETINKLIYVGKLIDRQQQILDPMRLALRYSPQRVGSELLENLGLAKRALAVAEIDLFTMS